MKVISRDFTIKEKVLILVLALILLALAYYWLVDQPVRRALEECETERVTLESDLAVAQARVAQLRSMRAELDELGALQETSRMESYNASKMELAALNQILSVAQSYSISFSGVSRSGDQIRRNFSLSFTTPDYSDAKGILTALSDCPMRCLVGNLSFSDSSRGESYRGGTVAGSYTVTANVSATFFETMYDGVPDAGLPSSN